MNHLIKQQIALPLALLQIQTEPRTKEKLSPFEILYGDHMRFKKEPHRHKKKPGTAVRKTISGAPHYLYCNQDQRTEGLDPSLPSEESL
ncbi:hypothetical protein DV515_00010655 [Chloebia gouldiae]|uniref:Uncharacterized protein n=1 Tax=Chloebia gouldiae TaxID=44316 RepID=A0A3L8S8K5_CHLGU|nr:hypothetical protein DV515_00010655 [Chloebia gouldiae]